MKTSGSGRDSAIGFSCSSQSGTIEQNQNGEKNMNIDFPLILVMLTGLAGLICLLDVLMLMPRRRTALLALQARYGDWERPTVRTRERTANRRNRLVGIHGRSNMHAHFSQCCLLCWYCAVSCWSHSRFHPLRWYRRWKLATISWSISTPTVSGCRCSVQKSSTLANPSGAT